MPKIVEDRTIFTAAVKEIVERGYSGATTKQIADVAGISEVTLFRKYGSKAELVKLAVSRMVERFEEDAVLEYTGDLKEDLKRVVEIYQASAQQSGAFFYTILTEVSRQPEISEIINGPFGMFRKLGALLKRYQDEGLLKEEEPFHSLASLLGPLMIINLMKTVTGAEDLIGVEPTVHVDNFLNGHKL